MILFRSCACFSLIVSYASGGVRKVKGPIKGLKSEPDIQGGKASPSTIDLTNQELCKSTPSRRSNPLRTSMMRVFRRRKHDYGEASPPPVDALTGIKPLYAKEPAVLQNPKATPPLAICYGSQFDQAQASEDRHATHVSDSAVSCYMKPRGVFDAIVVISDEYILDSLKADTQIMVHSGSGAAADLISVTDCKERHQLATYARILESLESTGVTASLLFLSDEVPVDWDDLHQCSRVRRVFVTESRGLSLNDYRLTFNARDAPVSVALAIASELVRLLKKLHSSGVSHGDISPISVRLRGQSLSEGLILAPFPFLSVTAHKQLADMHRVVLIMKEMSSQVVPLIRSGEGPLATHLQSVYYTLRSATQADIPYEKVASLLDEAALFA